MRILKEKTALLKLKLRQLHLVLGITNLAAFTAGVVAWKYTTLKVVSTINDNRVKWIDNETAVLIVNKSYSYDLALVLWIGALILSVLHFAAFFFWRSRPFGIYSLSDRFGKRKDPSSRWFFYFATTLLCYIIMAGFSIEVYGSTFCLLVLVAIGGSSTLYLFDKINLPYVVMKEVDYLERMVEIENFDEENGSENHDEGKELKRIGSDVGQTTDSRASKYKKLTKRFRSLDCSAWILGLFITLFIDILFLVYNFTSDELSLAPISFSITICLFVVYSLWAVLTPAFMYHKWTSVSHITNTISLHTVVAMTYLSVYVVVMIGIYV